MVHVQVPGDIVLLKSGDKVPADMRLTEATNLQVQEAMLTGESVPVSKHLKAAAPNAPLGDRKCMAYSATSVVSGQGKGVVVGTGDSAEIGQINQMVSTVSEGSGMKILELCRPASSICARSILGAWWSGQHLGHCKYMSHISQVAHQAPLLSLTSL